MDSKIIEWRKELDKLFPNITNRKLLDNYIWCEKCNGVGITGDGKYISFCSLCGGIGMIELCQNKCGNKKDRYNNFCMDCKRKEFNKKRLEQETATYEKAKKIKFAEYDGAFWDDSWSNIKDKADFEDWLYEQIEQGDDYPTYVYATYKRLGISIDIKDVIYNACEDGYEDMSEHLDYSGIAEIQELIDKWVESQEGSQYVYEVDYSKVILLDDIITELKSEV